MLEGAAIHEDVFLDEGLASYSSDPKQQIPFVSPEPAKKVEKIEPPKKTGAETIDKEMIEKAQDVQDKTQKANQKLWTTSLILYYAKKVVKKAEMKERVKAILNS